MHCDLHPKEIHDFWSFSWISLSSILFDFAPIFWSLSLKKHIRSANLSKFHFLTIISMIFETVWAWTRTRKNYTSEDCVQSSQQRLGRFLAQAGCQLRKRTSLKLAACFRWCHCVHSVLQDTKKILRVALPFECIA